MYFLNFIPMCGSTVLNFIDEEAVVFGLKNKRYKIQHDHIKNLIIYNNDLAYPIVYQQVKHKFTKLMSMLPDLIVNDDESGTSVREALNDIERFRQIIKNKYRSHLKQKDIQFMSKQLVLIQKEAKRKYREISKSNLHIAEKSSCK